MNAKLLTNDDVLKLAGALARLDELNNTAPALVVSDGSPPADTDQEKRDLVAFLAEGLINNGGQLLACYFAMEREYRPLLRALIPIFNRITATVQTSAASKNEENSAK